MTEQDLPPSPGPSLLTVIVNYRTSGLVIDCLQSLFEHSTLPSDGYVVVADAASDDGSVSRMEAAIASHHWRDRTTLLPLEVNGGFSYSNNRALEHGLRHFGRPRFVLFLNPDTVVRPGGLKPLLDFLQSNPAAGMAGAHLEDPDGTPQACAFRFPTILGELESESRIGPISRLLSRWRIAPPMPDEPSQVDWVSGAAMLVRMELLEEIGLFDENYFLYFEEVDLCLRATHVGWQCWHIPQSHIIHLVGCSTGVTKRTSPSRRPAYWFKSRQLYFLKHHGRIYLGVADLAWIFGQLLWRFRQTVEIRRDIDPPYLLRDFVFHSMGLRLGRDRVRSPS